VRVVSLEALRPAVFLRRENRFVVRVRLPEGGDAEVLCHLANSGRLQELLIPEARCFVWSTPVSHPQGNHSQRKTAYKLGFVEIAGGRGWASVDATLPNALVAECLRRSPGELYSLLGLAYPRKDRQNDSDRGISAAAPLPSSAVWEREVRFGDSRIDFLLKTAGEASTGENSLEAGTFVCAGQAPAVVLLEVKSVTLVKDGVALFPDAPTARGHRHLEHLLRAMHQQSMGAAILFVVQREDATCFAPNWQADPVFAGLLQQAAAAGLKVVALPCQVKPPAVELQLHPLPIRL